MCLVNPVLSATDFNQYFNASCSILLGGLVLRGLPIDVDEDMLTRAFGTVQKIMGPLVIDANSHLMGLPFLAQLQTAASVAITNNVKLIDARLPALDVATQLSVVEFGNYRTCNAKRAGVVGAVSADPIPCPTRTLVFALELTCPGMIGDAVALIAIQLGVPKEIVCRKCFF